MSKFTKWGENFSKPVSYFLFAHSVNDSYSRNVLNIWVHSVKSFPLSKKHQSPAPRVNPLSCWFLSRSGLASSLLPLGQVFPPHHMITGGTAKPERRMHNQGSMMLLLVVCSCWLLFSQHFSLLIPLSPVSQWVHKWLFLNDLLLHAKWFCTVCALF